MTLPESIPAPLPLRRVSHRVIALNSGAPFCKVHGAASDETIDVVASLIVRAVNAHTDMVDALERFVSEYRANDLTVGAVEDAEAALAKATGQ